MSGNKNKRLRWRVLLETREGPGTVVWQDDNIWTSTVNEVMSAEVQKAVIRTLELTGYERVQGGWYWNAKTESMVHPGRMGTYLTDEEENARIAAIAAQSKPMRMT